jgi:hypothetical protein
LSNNYPFTDIALTVEFAGQRKFSGYRIDYSQSVDRYTRPISIKNPTFHRLAYKIASVGSDPNFGQNTVPLSGFIEPKGEVLSDVFFGQPNWYNRRDAQIVILYEATNETRIFDCFKSSVVQSVVVNMW